MSLDSAGRGAPTSEIDFSTLYDTHPEYVARREEGSLEQAQIDIEVRLFKLPNLMRLLSSSRQLRTVLEIGCATGELIAALPVVPGARKVGMDISAANIAVASARYPDIEFHCSDSNALQGVEFDAVIMSDVLEHVPHDQEFLRAAAQLGDVVLVNLPLEDNWLNWRRDYGVNDVSGHLRKYSLADGMRLFELAGLDVLTHTQVWFHETAAEHARRALREQRLGSAFSGSWPERAAKRTIVLAAAAVPPLGRRIFSSNLFAMACKRPPR
ncbi:class I SAM-dependent methyltransferase [Variovorax sp. LjRoot130]|uniref:class I SAM-dependent methyltransferase n=1 Tax=Variovorax sp. LjRoot130 TaxID=3342261 RepID=UPI003ECF847C